MVKLTLKDRLPARPQGVIYQPNILLRVLIQASRDAGACCLGTVDSQWTGVTKEADGPNSHALVSLKLTAILDTD